MSIKKRKSPSTKGRSTSADKLIADLRAAGIDESVVMMMGRESAPRLLLEMGIQTTEHAVRVVQGKDPRSEWKPDQFEFPIADQRARAQFSEDLPSDVLTPELAADPGYAGSTIQRDKDGNIVRRWDRHKNVGPRNEVGEQEMTEWREKLLSLAIVRDESRSRKMSGPECTQIINVSDPQIGKQGTAEAIDNVLGGVDEAMLETERLMDAGANIKQIVFHNGGDAIENQYNFEGQAYQNDLDLAAEKGQLETHTDTFLAALVRCTSAGLPLIDISHLSNHGEAGRVGRGNKDQMTRNGNNWDLYLSRQREKFAKLTPALADVTFLRPETNRFGDTEHFVVADLSGELVYFSHGYIEHGKGLFQEKASWQGVKDFTWAERTRLHRVRLALLGHFHHYYVMTNADLTVMGIPATEAFRSSSYLAGKGIWSRPAVLSVLAGEGLGDNGWARPTLHTSLKLVA